MNIRYVPWPPNCNAKSCSAANPSDIQCRARPAPLKTHSGHRGGQKNILTAKTQTSGATIIVGEGYPIFDSHREFLLTEIRSSFSPFNCQWPDERKMRACRSLVLTVPEWLQDRSKRIWQSNPNNALYAPVTNTARFCRWGLWRSLCQKYCRSSLDVRL